MKSSGARSTSGDASGWKRGECGYGKNSSVAKFLRPDADLGKLYGAKHGGGNQGDPGGGKLKDTFKGYEGVDGDGGTQ